MKPLNQAGYRLFVTLALLLFGGAAQADKVRVLTSFLPMYCFAANVAGDKAEVENLLPATVGPHDYQFTPQDRRKLSKANLIVVNGLGLESWLDRAIESSGGHVVVVEAAAGLEKELIREGNAEANSHHDSAFNPHIWLDPQLACHAVTNILHALQKADPVNAAFYANNAAAYVARLNKLDAELQQGVTGVRDTYFVTYHNAFPYFIRRYQLKLAGVMEETPEVDPSPRYLSQLTRTVRDKKARAIFVEPQFSSALAEQLAKDLNIRLAELNTMETGKFTTSAYEDIMRGNLRALQEALK